MHVLFLIEDSMRERTIASCFRNGVEAHGKKCTILRVNETISNVGVFDLIVTVGIKNRLLLEAFAREGGHYVIIDKGYFGGPDGPRSKYMRVSIDALQPHAYFSQFQRTHDRLGIMGVELKKTIPGHNILLVGGSETYAQWHDLPKQVDWAQGIVNEIREYSNQPIIYRPKPRHGNQVPIGAVLSSELIKINDELKNASVVISYGSNVGIDALINGIPNVVLGDGIVRSLAQHHIADLQSQPYYPTDRERWNLLANISYCQWSLSEFQSGEAWTTIQQQIRTIEDTHGNI